jgi:prolipoprotein diacylglyceryltransferase
VIDTLSTILPTTLWVSIALTVVLALFTKDEKGSGFFMAIFYLVVWGVLRIVYSLLKELNVSMPLPFPPKTFYVCGMTAGQFLLVFVFIVLIDVIWNPSNRRTFFKQHG